MVELDRGTVMFHGLLDALAQFVREWRPPTLRSEREYRDSLFETLRAAIPSGCRVEREYRHAGTTADLYVYWQGLFQSDEVYIEIKRDLTVKAECDRLIGQVEGLKPDKHKVLIVLCGSTQSALAGRVAEHFGGRIHDVFPTVRIAMVACDEGTGSRPLNE